MRRLRVSDVMTTEVITAREATPFKELARIMTERRVSALPVLDTADRLVGMVSEADLLPKEEHRDDHPGRWALKFGGDHASRIKAAGDTAGHLKTSPVVVTHPDASLVEAAKEMAQRHVKRLPVVDTDDHLVGIISRADLLKVFLRDDEEIRHEVISEILIRVLWANPERFDVQVRDGIVTLSGAEPHRSRRRQDCRLRATSDTHMPVARGTQTAITRSGSASRIESTASPWVDDQLLSIEIFFGCSGSGCSGSGIRISRMPSR